MVTVYTNKPEYRNDIAEELRLFLGNVSVAFAEDEAAAGPDGFCILSDTGGGRTEAAARAVSGGQSASASFELPDDSKLVRKRLEKRALKIAAFRLFRQLYGTPTPWGSLTGIRPTKLFRELTETGGEAAARESFLHTFDVSPEKTELAEAICRAQRPIVGSVANNDVDVYVHIPFCRSRCLYCSFGTVASENEAAFEPYLAALHRDIAAGGELMRRSGLHVRATYFGGGTPSVLSERQLAALLTCVLDAYGTFGTECTFEAGRPDTITPGKLAVLCAFGVGRVSVNPQTMNDDTLRRVGRLHTASDVAAAYELARKSGFSTVNMDVIAGLPGETAEDMAHTLERICALAPDNLTVHTLAVKRSSRLHERLDEYALPAADEAERMVRLGAEYADKMGLAPYYLYRQKYMQGNLENVGYARANATCVYNVDMMEELVGILAHGAHGISKRVFGGENRIERLPNPKDIPTYISKLPALIEAKDRLFGQARYNADTRCMPGGPPP